MVIAENHLRIFEPFVVVLCGIYIIFETFNASIFPLPRVSCQLLYNVRISPMGR